MIGVVAEPISWCYWAVQMLATAIIIVISSYLLDPNSHTFRPHFWSPAKGIGLFSSRFPKSHRGILGWEDSGGSQSSLCTYQVWKCIKLLTSLSTRFPMCSRRMVIPNPSHRVLSVNAKPCGKQMFSASTRSLLLCCLSQWVLLAALYYTCMTVFSSPTLGHMKW